MASVGILILGSYLGYLTPAIDSTLEFLLSRAGVTVAVLLAVAGMIVTVVATWRLSLQQASFLEDTICLNSYAANGYVRNASP